MSAPVHIPLGIKRKLRVLEFPLINELDALDVEGFLRGPLYWKVVHWIEEEKIRLLPPAERKGLADFEVPLNWWKAVEKYCHELGLGPLPPPDLVTRMDVVNRLLSLAMEDAYQDGVEMGKIRSTSPEQAIPANQIQDGHSSDGLSSECILQINDLLAQVGLPSIKAGEVHNIGPALEAILARLEPSPPLTSPIRQMSSVPIGFKLPQNSIRDIAVVLRVLHVEALQETQREANNIISAAQSLTADPKTENARRK